MYLGFKLNGKGMIVFGKVKNTKMSIEVERCEPFLEERKLSNFQKVLSSKGLGSWIILY